MSAADAPFDPEQPVPGEPPATLNHVGLTVSDLDASIRFYLALGFTVDRELELPDAHVAPVLDVAPPFRFRAVYLRLGEFLLELMHFDGADRPHRELRVMHELGLTHLSISVVDLAGAVAAVPDAGGEVLLSYPMVAMVRDPDGQILELLPMSWRRQIDHERARSDP